ncbi:hypothetical protein, partial [Acinetobacter guillouiae]|uniref:hypothetical protein n=1 Tax=Acinetobacter guillouiae TaxID=106649 RepID=UPI00300B71FE
DNSNTYVVNDEYRDDLFSLEWVQEINYGWLMWQAAKATPEGFVFNDVFAERKRQIDQEHHSHEHDDEYDQNELIRAASSYLSHVIGRGWVFKETCPETYQDEEAPDLWPWDLDFWKPKNPRRDLVRAAALIIAEIEKIDRSTGAKS